MRSISCLGTQLNDSCVQIKNFRVFQVYVWVYACVFSPPLSAFSACVCLFVVCVDVHVYVSKVRSQVT